MATEMFLEIAEVPGESQKKTNAIDIESWSFGAANPTTVSRGKGSAEGVVSVSEMTISKVLDKASTKLFNQCCAGKHFATATITCRESKGDATTMLDYLVIKLTQVFINNFSWSSGGMKASESIALSFGKIEMTYKIQNADGSEAAGGDGAWDVRTNQG
jgi:type VI secretion system secreted protein Hcp